MIWLLGGGIPLALFIIWLISKDPAGWFFAIGVTLVFMALLGSAVYGAQQLGWIPND